MSLYECEFNGTYTIVCKGCQKALHARHDRMLEFIKSYKQWHCGGCSDIEERIEELLKEIGKYPEKKDK